MAEFTNKHTWQKVIEENTNQWVFLPASGGRQRKLKRRSCIKGAFVNKKKVKKGRASVYKTMHVGFERQLRKLNMF